MNTHSLQKKTITKPHIHKHTLLAGQSLLLTYLLSIPNRISPCLFVFVLKNLLQIVSREKQSSILSSACIIQFTFEDHVLLILTLILITRIFAVVTHSIDPIIAFELVIVNLQLPCTNSKPGEVSHHGTRNAATQVTIERAPKAYGMSRYTHPIKRSNTSIPAQSGFSWTSINTLNILPYISPVELIQLVHN